MGLVWRQMHWYLHLVLYLAMQERTLSQVRILPLLCGRLVLFPLLISWIANLEYKDLLVTSSGCWYMLVLMGKVFFYWEEMPPDLLYWSHLKRLPLIMPLCFLYWTFNKGHESPLHCLHLVLRKVVKIQWLLGHIFLKDSKLFFQ